MAIEFKPLVARDIEVRVGQAKETGVSLLLYKDARCDMRALDDSVGAEHWDCSYQAIDGNLYCTVGIQADGEWVYKQDVGVPSNMEGEKGAASDAFKRACFKWGIGRELYSAPFIWVNADACKIVTNKQGKPACYDRFEVTKIETKDGIISALEIKNASTNKICYKMGQAPKSTTNGTAKKSTEDKRAQFLARVNELIAEAVDLGIQKQGIESFAVSQFDKPINLLNADELQVVGEHTKQLIADMRKLKEGE